MSHVGDGSALAAAEPESLWSVFSYHASHAFVSCWRCRGYRSKDDALAAQRADALQAPVMRSPDGPCATGHINPPLC